MWSPRWTCWCTSRAARSSVPWRSWRACSRPGGLAGPAGVRAGHIAQPPLAIRAGTAALHAEAPDACRSASCGTRVLRCTYANSLLLPVALMKFRLWEPLTAEGSLHPAFKPCRGGWTRLLYSLPRAPNPPGWAAGFDLPAGPITSCWWGRRLMMTTDKYPSLSVFFPAYNDAPSLPSLIASAVTPCWSSTWRTTRSSS